MVRLTVLKAGLKVAICVLNVPLIVIKPVLESKTSTYAGYKAAYLFTGVIKMLLELICDCKTTIVDALLSPCLIVTWLFLILAFIIPLKVSKVVWKLELINSNSIWVEEDNASILEEIYSVLVYNKSISELKFTT